MLQRIDQRQIVIYARVSTRNQKDDLKNQVAFLRQFCNARGKIQTIIITHKDWFIRFGYKWFERFCRKFHTSIIVVNNEELSPQEELVSDIVSILYMFSCRLYGLRKYKKQIERG